MGRAADLSTYGRERLVVQILEMATDTWKPSTYSNQLGLK